MGLASAGPAPIMPSRVVVLYNSAVPESVALAKSYQQARSIPTVNLIGLEMPDREEITRQEYDDLIRKPLRDEFEKRVWWRLAPAEGNVEVAVENRMQVMVCMRGVPLKIARVVAAEAAEKKPAAAGEKPQVEQPLAVANVASLDRELSILSWSGHPLNGPLKNAFFESKQGIEEVSLPYLMLVGRVAERSWSG